MKINDLKKEINDLIELKNKSFIQIMVILI